MKKMNQANSNIHEHNRGHVSESNQRSGEGVSFSKLKAQFLQMRRTHSNMIDVADYAELTVRTDNGVYQPGDCERHHADSQEGDCSSTSVIYGAACRIEGHVCDIRGCLDENEDASQARISDREE
jgi:hypothetical protein